MFSSQGGLANCALLFPLFVTLWGRGPRFAAVSCWSGLVWVKSCRGCPELCQGQCPQEGDGSFLGRFILFPSQTGCALALLLIRIMSVSVPRTNK